MTASFVPSPFPPQKGREKGESMFLQICICKENGSGFCVCIGTGNGASAFAG